MVRAGAKRVSRASKEKQLELQLRILYVGVTHNCGWLLGDAPGHGISLEDAGVIAGLVTELLGIDDNTIGSLLLRSKAIEVFKTPTRLAQVLANCTYHSLVRRA